MDVTPPSALRRFGLALAGVAVAALTGAACVLSFDDLRALAVLGESDPDLAYLYPAAFDAVLGVALLGVLLLRSARALVRAQAALVLVLLIVAAASANVATALRLTVDARAAALGVALAPWVMVAVGLWLWLLLINHVQARRAADRPAAPAEPGLVPFEDDRVQEPAVTAPLSERVTRWEAAPPATERQMFPAVRREPVPPPRKAPEPAVVPSTRTPAPTAPDPGPVAGADGTHATPDVGNTGPATEDDTARHPSDDRVTASRDLAQDPGDNRAAPKAEEADTGDHAVKSRTVEGRIVEDRETANPETVDRETAGLEVAGQAVAGREATSREVAGSEAVGDGPRGRGDDADDGPDTQPDLPVIPVEPAPNPVRRPVRWGDRVKPTDVLVHPKATERVTERDVDTQPVRVIPAADPGHGRDAADDAEFAAEPGEAPSQRMRSTPLPPEE
ncbi:hypothetical protein [Nonomuraea longicatena]|uniref:DUF2637 domain-containing protein n=1 Tax=Nonomuraea longicatena TaxID=83682 RepID=A0ABP4B9Q8_9ACTN